MFTEWNSCKGSFLIEFYLEFPKLMRSLQFMAAAQTPAINPLGSGQLGQLGELGELFSHSGA